MKKMIKISTLTVTASLLAVAAQADKWSDQFPHIKNTGDIAGECSYESMYCLHYVFFLKKKIRRTKIKNKTGANQRKYVSLFNPGLYKT